MSTPAIIVIVLLTLSLATGAALDGDDKTGKHKFSISMFRAGLWVGLLYWGGFFQ